MENLQPITSRPTPPHLIRAARPEDASFIYNSWLQSFRDAPMVKGVPNSIYYKEQHRLIEDILAQPTCKVAVVCNPDDHHQIYAYSVYDLLGAGMPLIIHWVYCKHPFRLFGLATKLAEHMTNQLPSIISYSHMTKMTSKVVKTRQMLYNPYLTRSA